MRKLFLSFLLFFATIELSQQFFDNLNFNPQHHINEVQHHFDRHKNFLEHLVQIVKGTLGEAHIGPDGYLSMMDFCEKYDYVCEKHHVETSDGYILTLHRLTGHKNRASLDRSRPTIFLMHGIWMSSSYFIMDGPSSPAGILLEQGYDIWMGNSRGNIYSRKHVKLNPKDVAFWRYTNTEMFLYDYPAFLDYILKVVQKAKLHFVGFSQGGIFMSALLAEKPEYNSKIQSLTFVASGLNAYEIKSTFANTLFRALEPISKNTIVPYSPFEVFAYNNQTVDMYYKMCNHHSIFHEPCVWYFESIMGKWDGTEFDKKRFPVYAAQLQTGGSSNQLLHYSQSLVRGRMSYYDYGHEENKKRYGQETVPVFNYTNILAPKIFFYGTDDSMMPEQSILKSVDELTNIQDVVKVEGYNHLDFMLAHDKKDQVYKKVVDFIEKND